MGHRWHVFCNCHLEAGEAAVETRIHMLKEILLDQAFEIDGGDEHFLVLFGDLNFRISYDN